ncbi:MAG TPA: DUF494 domain-containing protein [Nevskiaceae bacterium]|nr:DUF494 domain-containing protein [Nevskiaceae bacterium]
MKETLLDVLLYLFENYADAETRPAANRDNLRDELTAAGFPAEEVEHAFAWLARLAQPLAVTASTSSIAPLRLYSAEEQAKLDTDCRGLIMGLERIGVLDGETRELVIELLMPLEIPVDVRVVKWAAMLVVLNRDAPAGLPAEDTFEGASLDLQALVEEGQQRLQ